MSYKPAGEPSWLSVEEARSRVEQAGLPFRHLELDSSVPYMLSADLRPGRVTARARSGVVIKVEVTN